MILRRSQLRFQALLIGLVFHTASEGQTLPAVTSDSGQFCMHPLVPAAGESTRLSATGDFAFSNAMISVDSFSVESELITIDLVSAWEYGYKLGGRCRHHALVVRSNPRNSGTGCVRRVDPRQRRDLSALLYSRRDGETRSGGSPRSRPDGDSHPIVGDEPEYAERCLDDVYSGRRVQNLASVDSTPPVR